MWVQTNKMIEEKNVTNVLKNIINVQKKMSVKYEECSQNIF